MKKRVVVFGLGGDWQEFRAAIEERYDIIGVSDNNDCADAGGYRRVAPANILKEDFDLIIINSTRFYKEIRCQLIEECGIDTQKMMVW